MRSHTCAKSPTGRPHTAPTNRSHGSTCSRPPTWWPPYPDSPRRRASQLRLRTRHLVDQATNGAVSINMPHGLPRRGAHHHPDPVWHVGFENSAALFDSGDLQRVRVNERHAMSFTHVPGDQGHAAESGTGQPRRGRVSRRRLRGRGGSPTSRKRYDGACVRRPVRAGSKEPRALAPRAAALRAATRRLSRSFFLRWRSLRHRRVDRDPLPTGRAYRRALAALPQSMLLSRQTCGVPRSR
jgi:hypothetical protein